MSDERAVEVIAEAMASHPSLREIYADKPEYYLSDGRLYGDPEGPEYPAEAPYILAALRAEGYDLYRPEEVFFVPLRRVVWCNRHDIPWASHVDLGMSLEGCIRGERMMKDEERAKKYGALYAGLDGETMGLVPVGGEG